MRSVELSRAETDALLYALDDADRLFMHHRGEELLALWQRLHRARCYLDGEQGYTGTPEERSLTLTARDALNVWLVVGAEMIRVQPTAMRRHLRAIVALCRPSAEHPERASVPAVDPAERSEADSWSTPNDSALTPSVRPVEGDDADRVRVPRWIFDHAGERFLVAIEPGGTVHTDGGHSDPQGVAKARELFQRLIVIRPPEGTRYVMVTVEEVPDFTGRLNQEAIAWNNHAACAPLSARPTQTTGER